jgi:pilus assembly protein FimV
LISKSQRWKKTAIAAATLALVGLSGSSALALSLGRISVQSALGEPLRAEIDIPQISAEELASLSTQVASPEMFAATGLEYHPELASLELSLQKRPDGRSFIRLSSNRPVNEPFLDMMLVANWSSGRIVRDYTILLDPPSLKRQAAAPAPTLPQASAPAPSPAPAPTTPAARSATAPAPEKTPPKPLAPAKASEPGAQRVTVHRGDSASSILGRNRAPGVSLDQMLVALLRANPDAFVKGNLNRLRAGAVLDLPAADQAKAVPAAEATQIVIAQSKDFNEYRRSLASAVPKAPADSASRKSTGSVDAKVDDNKPTSNTPDKLTLSKGSVKAKDDEARIAKERAEKDASTRAAEISRNIKELNQLGVAATTNTQPAGTPPATSPPASEAAKAPVAAVPAAPPATPAPASTAAATTTAAPASPAGNAAPGLLDALLSGSGLPLAAGGLLALLGGLAFLRLRNKRSKAQDQIDSSFLESRLQPESFFGENGGEQVNSPDAAQAQESSFGLSKMDAPDDVDPLAEADVYLAYGRDAQAEEILKAALEQYPDRMAVYNKLLGIYAKRQDAASFKSVALQVLQHAGENSPEWLATCEQGLGIDPGNTLYLPGGASLSADFASPDLALDSEQAQEMTTHESFSSPAPLTDAGVDVDLDLDLDFSAEDAADTGAFDPTPDEMAAMSAEPDAQAHELPLDFDISRTAVDMLAPAETAEPEPVASLPVHAAALDDLSLEELQTPSLAADATPLAEALNFDLDSLSLELEPKASSPEAHAAVAEAGLSDDLGLELPESAENPLETKLALADEFVAIGDTDGARALIQEVVSEASGKLRERAQAALAQLS